MNNIQKAFKTKSKLRCMADGGQIDPNVLGSGMAQRAGAALQGRRAQLDAAIDAAERGEAPPSAPATDAAPAPAKKPEEKKSALRSFFGLADGGQIMKNDVGGVPTFTDSRAATAGAKAYTPGQGGGTFSVMGMEPEQRQVMEQRIAEQKAAAAAPTTLGGRLDAALSSLRAPGQSAAGQTSIGKELDGAIGRLNGVSSPATPPPGVTPAAGINRITKNDVGGVPTFTDQRAATAGAKAYTPGQGGSSFSAAAPTSLGDRLGATAQRTPNIPVDTVYPSQVQQDYQDFFGLADGGKVKGKGGPTDDEVGPVMLSHGEYVLPADTVKVVGRDNLDKLRLATHEFVDEGNKPKVSGLRKMADGGAAGISVDELNDPASRRAFNQARAAIRAGNPYSAQSVLNDAIPRQAPAAPAAAPAAAAPPASVPPAATSSLRTAVNSGGGRVAGFVRGSLPVAAIGGAVDSFGDMNTGYRDKFNESLGATGPVSSVAGDAARVMGNVGDAITFGLGGRLGRGFSNLTSGGSFTDGFMSESDRDKYNREEMQRVMGQQAPAAVQADGRTPIDEPKYHDPKATTRGGAVDGTSAFLRPTGDPSSLRATGADPNSAYAQAKPDTVIGSFNGRPITKAEADLRASSLQTVGSIPQQQDGGPQEDPIIGEIRSALRGLTEGGGRGGGGGGGGGAVIGGGGGSNAREINERYDKLAKQLSGMYSAKGQGNLARRLLELEQSRYGALDMDARNQSALRGQNMQASTAANNTKVQALQTLGMMANQHSTQNAQAQAAQLKALQDAEKTRVDRMKDNAEVADYVADTFAAGDKKLALQYRELLNTLGPELDRVAQDLAPQEKRAFYTNIMREQLGRNEGLVLGREKGSMFQNAVLGSLLGRMARFGNGAGGKVVDAALGKIPRVGPVLSALRPAERLSNLGTVLGAVGGAYVTPEVEDYSRYDPPARDPETGAALPARKDVREAFTYGAFDTYLNPFDDSVQTVSGRRTNKPTPDEEEAARRIRSVLRDK